MQLGLQLSLSATKKIQITRPAVEGATVRICMPFFFLSEKAECVQTSHLCSPLFISCYTQISCLFDEELEMLGSPFPKYLEAANSHGLDVVR